MQKYKESSMLANPTYLAGKLAYWQEIPIGAIKHCATDVVDAWSRGWRDAQDEHLLLRSQIARNRGNISSINGPAVLQ